MFTLYLLCFVVIVFGIDRWWQATKPAITMVPKTGFTGDGKPKDKTGIEPALRYQITNLRWKINH